MAARLIRRSVAALGLAGAVFVGVDADASDLSFSDQTVAAGVDVSHASSGFDQSQYSGGGTVGDFNRDGWQDIFVFSGGSSGQRDRLFINNGDGTFTDEATAWGVAALHRGKAACVGDYDGNGWLDIYVLSAGFVGSPAAGRHRLYQNNGDGTFTDVAVFAGVNFTHPTQEDGWACCFGDYDLDGDLDLYAGGFSEASQQNLGKRLYRNNGDGTFTDVATDIGMFVGVGAIANLSARFMDMNGDQYPELLLAGDFKGQIYVGSRYFRNNGDGTFSDATNSSNTGDEENGMGQTAGDFNNDGLYDWYVTSIYLPQISWTGNKLYTNHASHSFGENAGGAGVDDGGYGWGAVAVDFDHDGRVDIAETNGDQSGQGTFGDEQSYLFLNAGSHFTDMALETGFAHFGKGRCLLNLDYDNDGDQDMVLMSNNEPLFLFRNDLGGDDANWLRVFLDADGQPGITPDGIGAGVTVKIGNETQTRIIDAGNSFLGVSELSAHFGLGAATTIDTLTVQWPNADPIVLTDVAANQTLVITPDVGPDCPADYDGNGTVGPEDLSALLAAWNTVNRDIDLDGNTIVNAADLAALLSAWGRCV